MNHQQAVDLHAAEKYVLGELPEAQRLEYEEHYFDCADCALDLKAAAAFVDASRHVFGEQAAAALAAARASKGAPVRTAWLPQFRWAFAAVPAFAALVLVLVVGYHRIGTIPQPRSASTQDMPSPDGPTFDLGASGTLRGGEKPANETPFVIRANQGFSLAFDFTPRTPFAAYVCQLQDTSGRVVLQVAVPAEKANQRFVLPVPGRSVPVPGNYRVVILGSGSASGQSATGSDVQHFVFTLAFEQ